MTEEIHSHVDTDTGHLRLLCNAAQFKRLSSWLREQANIGPHLITIPATEIRTVSVELVTEDETPPGAWKQLASYGCAIAMIGGAVTMAIGMMTVIGWVIK